LLHELVHLRRGDHLVRLLELTVAVAFWWLPVVGFAGQQMRACEEACCDATVVAKLPGARRAYARLLLDVVDFVRPLRAAPQATAMGARDLERRLVAILDGPEASKRRLPGAITVAVGLAVMPCGFTIGTVVRPATVPAAAETGSPPVPQSWTAPDRDTAKLTICCPS
jgi:beta-lactamase regulating signal transducer with metallopeptidase domain